MIIPFEYGTRKDGVKLFRRLDVKVDENDNPLFVDKTITDENGNTKTVKEPIPTGFKIRKIGTDEVYDEAIDVDNALFVYEETDEPIETNLFNDINI
jgi:hypothetical protein